ncbi:MarR family winged helix-turn-helix transcriptional regulator [Colwelliaceae bacterium 6471]
MSDLLKLDQQLCFRIYSISKTMNRLYAPLLKKLQLTYPQYLVMLALWEHKEAMTVSQLGQTLDLDSGTLSPLLKRMENQSLLTRSRSLADERSVKIELTAHGKNIKKDAKHIPAKLFNLTGLSHQEMKALRSGLDLLMANIKTTEG